MREPVVLDLPPNATYPTRFFVWVRYSEPGFPVWGVITVAETAKGRRQVVRRYVAEEYVPRAAAGRGFAFRKPMSPACDEPVHHAVVGKDNLCRCRGFVRLGTCVHLQCLTALAAAGHLSESREGGARATGKEVRPARREVGGRKGGRPDRSPNIR